MNFNFRGEKSLIHEANVLKSDPVTLRFFLCRNIFNSEGGIHMRNCKEICGVEFLQLSFSFFYFSKIHSTELSIVFPISVSVANEEISI